ncbi:hypothetical protein ACLMAL_12465 [Nocardia sp. CWNU-33]|uniref:hypothetical protein n=1 Tax=Nocardia sp. CWNU-33 TaxID=3392117 RepID=UPI00398F55A3
MAKSYRPIVRCAPRLDTSSLHPCDARPATYSGPVERSSAGSRAWPPAGPGCTALAAEHDAATLATTQAPPAVLPATLEESALLLFPGFDRRRPLDRGTFGTRLNQHGITPHASRNTALVTLATELPAAVLADLLGLHPGTAVRWVRIAKRDWHTHLAERRTALNH